MPPEQGSWPSPGGRCPPSQPRPRPARERCPPRADRFHPNAVPTPGRLSQRECTRFRRPRRRIGRSSRRRARVWFQHSEAAFRAGHARPRMTAVWQARGPARVRMVSPVYRCAHTATRRCVRTRAGCRRRGCHRLERQFQAVERGAMDTTMTAERSRRATAFAGPHDPRLHRADQAARARAPARHDGAGDDPRRRADSRASGWCWRRCSAAR